MKSLSKFIESLGLFVTTYSFFPFLHEKRDRSKNRSKIYTLNLYCKYANIVAVLIKTATILVIFNIVLNITNIVAVIQLVFFLFFFQTFSLWISVYSISFFKKIDPEDLFFSVFNNSIFYDSVFYESEYPDSVFHKYEIPVKKGKRYFLISGIIGAIGYYFFSF